MGSACNTVEEVVDYLRSQGEKVGVVRFGCIAPSPSFTSSGCAQTVKRIAVLDRTKETGSLGEPLYLDVVKAFQGEDNQPLIVGGRYGLGSKDTRPSQILAVYRNLKEAEPKDRFTIGIVDDVSGSSLPEEDSWIQHLREPSAASSGGWVPTVLLVPTNLR